MTTDQDIADYVASYAEDNSKVAFLWDGTHSDDFVDENAEFREAVLTHVLQNPDATPLALVVALYHALTQMSAEAWGIDSRAETLGRLMLDRGRSAVARDYVEGTLCSFDAHCGTSFAGCPRDVATECLDFARNQLSAATCDDEKALWEAGVERFAVLLEHAQ